MESLGEAAKLWVYLKYAEFGIGLFIMPFFLFFFFKMFNKVLGRF